MTTAVLTDAPPVRLSVLYGFELEVDGSIVATPTAVERMLAFLGIRDRPQLRTTVASTLWLDTREDRAAANLRTALWKARRMAADCVDVTGSYVALAPTVEVDLTAVLGQAKRLVGTGDALAEADARPETLGGDLLPDWDEDWIIFERERLRQLRIHALEALCRRLSDLGRHAEAIDAGLSAVAAEPLRESAQRALVAAHLAEGNRSEARRQYLAYAGLVRTSLGIAPSPEIRAMVDLPLPG